MKTYFILFIFLASLIPSFAQTQDGRQDMIYLKNGTIYRGVIIEEVFNVSYKIRIMGGSEIVIPADQVETVTKRVKVYSEAGDSSKWHVLDEKRMRKVKDKILIPYGYKNEGGFFQIQLNGQFAGGSIRFIGGYKFDQFGMLGLGLGLGGIFHGANQPFFIDGVYDPYGGLYVPFFLYYSGEILKKNITPFYAIEIGYGIGSSPGQQGDVDYYYPVHYTKGGYMGSAGFGVRFYAGRKFVCSLSLALDLQHAGTETFYLGYTNGPYTSYTGSMDMLLPTFKLGIGLLK